MNHLWNTSFSTSAPVLCTMVIWPGLIALFAWHPVYLFISFYFFYLFLFCCSGLDRRIYTKAAQKQQQEQLRTILWACVCVCKYQRRQDAARLHAQQRALWSLHHGPRPARWVVSYLQACFSVGWCCQVNAAGAAVWWVALVVGRAAECRAVPCIFESVQKANMLPSKMFNYIFADSRLTLSLAGRYRFVGEAEKASETLSTI